MKHDNLKQSLRLRRLYFAVALYVTGLLFGLMAYEFGLIAMSYRQGFGLIAGILITNAVFFALLSSGLNLRARDPSLILPQCIVGMSWVLVLMHAAPQIRDLMMVVYVTVMMFGVHQLGKRAFWQLSFFAMGGYMGVVILNTIVYVEQIYPWRELLRLIVLSTVLIWNACFGGYVSHIRQRLLRQNRRLRQAIHELRTLADIDDLTRIYNRRFIMDTLDKEQARAARGSGTFSICILDIDNFKNINDQYGHLTGDRVLKTFCERTRGELRQMDLIERAQNAAHAFGRYGGEEFIVVLPDTDREGAFRCAERIRESTAANCFDDVLRVTLSAGVAQFHPGETLEDTLRRADKALYLAKQSGRDRVECMLAWRDDSSQPNAQVVALDTRRR